MNDSPYPCDAAECADEATRFWPMEGGKVLAACSRHAASVSIDWRLTPAQHDAMMRAVAKLRTTLLRAVVAHGATDEAMPAVYRELRLVASAIAARQNVFHVGDDELAQFERRARGHVDYTDKFPLYIAQRMWGVR